MKLWLFTGLILLSTLLFGCSLSNPHLDNLRANYAFSRGDYQEATVLYLQNLEDDQNQDAIAYNLANVYYALGEFTAAQNLWQRSARTQDPELLFRILFNKGVYYYTQGQYTQAKDSFIQSLKIQPQSVPAKKNLELTLVKLRALPGNPNSRVETENQESPDDEAETSSNTLRIFDYLRRKEGQTWTGTSQEDTSGNALDW